ncbi:PIN domain-containing protein [Geodermatophilus tzadiensis]|uniref:PIN domain-containing protein n=1 Tax=Geodermatophilus tzadiensis TaxID=1137988 RepID=A0A2T0T905_9ACTN|nr:PIN domain-containing protein [Geodermatophilus tzadiensis]PRY42167.1 PIN domain-containing protein [Geodermatophilus tzadiensis]
MLLPEFIPSVSGLSNVLLTLQTVDQNLRNLSGHSGSERLQSYQRWSNEAARSLGFVFDPADVERMVLTPRHWVLQGWASPAAGDLNNLIDVEQTDRVRLFERLLRQYQELEMQWGSSELTLVAPDTNVYLQTADYFDEIDWCTVSGRVRTRVIVPITVVKEIDKHKHTYKKVKVKNKEGKREEVEIATRARSSAWRLRQTIADPTKVAQLPLGAEMELLLDPLTHRRMDDADSEIIDRLLALKQLTGHQVSVVTQDGNMQFVAKINGLDVLPL